MTFRFDQEYDDPVTPSNRKINRVFPEDAPPPQRLGRKLTMTLKKKKANLVKNTKYLFAH